MGLLEKALQYKKEINRKGKATLIDRIKGPAETDIIDEGYPSLMKEEDSLNNNTDKALKTSIDDATREEGIGNNNLDNTTDHHESESKHRYEVIEEATPNEDLFELPESDDHSPLEALNKQTGDTNKVYKSYEEREIEKENIGEDLEYEEDDWDPLSIEDEPVIINDVEEKTKEEEAYQIKAEEDIKDNDKMIKPDEEIPLPDIEQVIDKKIEPTLEPLEKSEKEEGHINVKKNVEAEFDRKTANDFQDINVLYETAKEIYSAKTKEDLYDIILFSITGQIGCASSSIMIPTPEDNNIWTIACSRGIKIRENIHLNPSEGILKHLKTDIIDIEMYKNNPDYTDQYDQFISLDTRLISPFNNNGEVLGTLLLGDKITGEDYSDEEKRFILSLCDTAAIRFSQIHEFGMLNEDNTKLKSDLDFSLHLYYLQDEIIKQASLKTIEDIIIKEFEELDIINFSIFINIEKDDNFIPLIVEKEDFLSMKETNFNINHNNPFIEFVKKLKVNQRIDKFEESDAIKKAFNDKQLKGISVFWIYPFMIGDYLSGFTIVFRIPDKNREDEIDNKVKKLSNILFSSILSIRSVEPEKNRYIDNFEIIFKRINSQIMNSKEINIPLTLILFSIRNFKRYFNLYGYKKSKELIDSFINTVKMRLSDTDFSARIDRNKILVALPGKDKKFAIPLANTIRNEIIQGFKKKEMQLLITFLTAEYPEDGDDLYSLLDNID